MEKKRIPFKNRLIEAMDLREMKSVDLCNKTGIRDSTISQYRSGYAEPKTDKLNIIAKALDVNPVWLMGLDVPMEIEAPKTKENASALADIMKDARLLEVVKKIIKMSAEKKEALYQYIDFLSSSN